MSGEVKSTRLIVYGYKPIDDSMVTEETKDEQDLSMLVHQQTLPDFFNSITLDLKCQVSIMASGHSHGLILTHDGRVFSFGSNQFGQRGIKVNMRQEREQNQGFQPTLIESLTGIVSISAGLYHSAAVTNTGAVYTWGRSIEGQLGLRNTECTEEPKKTELSGMQLVVCGGSHTLFLSRKGLVWAVGDNQWGQLGVDAKQPTVPLQILSLSGVVQVAAGCEHSLFLTQDGSVWVCGNNLFGQCGIEGVQSVDKPIKLALKDKVVKIYSSLGTFSALKTHQDQIYIWGTGSWGHARKPTNLLNTCVLQQSQSVERFKDIIMADNYALLINHNAQVHLLGTHKLPDIKNPNSKIECRLLNIEQSEQMSASNRFILVSKPIIMKSEVPSLLVKSKSKLAPVAVVVAPLSLYQSKPTSQTQSKQDTELSCSNLTDTSKDKVNIREYLDQRYQRDDSLLDAINNKTNRTSRNTNRETLRTQEDVRCTKCAEYQDKLALLENRLQNQEEMMTNYHRDKVALQDQVKKQNQLIEQQKLVIDEFKLMLPQEHHNQQNERTPEKEKQYVDNYSFTGQKQTRKLPTDQSLALQHSYSQHQFNIKAAHENASNKENETAKKYIQSLSQTNLLRPNQQSTATKLTHDNKYFNERSLTPVETRVDLQHVNNWEVRQTTAPGGEILLPFLSSRDDDNDQPLESSIKQNLNKSRGLIQNIDTILTQFKSTNNNNNNNNKQFHHEKTKSSNQFESSTESINNNPNVLIKTYFQRIEQLQQNIAKSKQELRKSLEASKFCAEQKEVNMMQNDEQQVDLLPVSMNERIHSRQYSQVQGVRKQPYKPTQTQVSLESKSAEKTKEQLRSKNVYPSILDYQSSRIKSDGKKSQMMRLEYRRNENIDEPYTKMRTLF